MADDDAASAYSGAASSIRDAGESGTVDPAFIKGSNKIKETIYGAIYTLHQQRLTSSRRLVYFISLLELCQLLAIVLSPQWHWNIDYGRRFFVALFSFAPASKMDEAGYTIFMVLLYALAALLVIGLVACAWVAILVKSGRLDAHHDHRRYVTALLLSLRMLLPVFFCIFYVAILGFFLSPTDCMKVSSATKDEYMLVNFPDKSCTDTGHLVMGVVGLVSALLLFLLVLALVACRTAADPLSPDITSTMSYIATSQLVLMQTILVVANHIPRLIGAKLASCIMLVSMMRAWHLILRFLPYYQNHMNRILSVFYAVLTWLCVCNVIMTFSRTTSDIMTIVGLALCPVAALVGYLAVERSIRRHLRYIPNKFVGFEVKVPHQDEDHYTFKHDHEAAIASRCAIFHMKRNNRVLLPDEIRSDAAELILLTAMEQFPQSAYLRMVYSNFLMYVRRNPSSSEAELTKVGALTPNAFLAYQIFVRAQERARGTDDVLGTSSMDFASYIEFMNSFKVVLMDHKSVLKSVRNFWKALLRDEVAFASLRRLLEQQKEREVRADRSYKILLERYPRNTKLLESYARFLDEVKNDTVAAGRYLRQAEKIEDEAKQAMDVGSDVEGGHADRVDDTRDGVCVINMQGIVQHVNKVTTRMFGFTKNELVGKNVRVMMPQPYQNNHDSYLHAYHTTGVAKVIGIPREMEGRHKNGYLVPVRLFVTKIDSNGSTQYMGILRSLPEDPRPKVHLDATGSVTSINRSFASQLGYAGDDLVTQPVSKVLMPLALQHGNNRHVGTNELLAYLEARAAADEGGDENLSLPGKEGTAFHKDGAELAVELGVTKMVGEGGVIFFTVTLRMLDDKLGIMSINHTGRIVSANKLVTEMFGYKESQLLKMNVSRLMPPPYSHFHDSYLSRYAKQGPSGRVLGVRGGRAVLGLHAEGHTFPINLEVKEFKDEATGRRMFSGRITLVDADSSAVAAPCLSLYLDENAQEIIKVEGDARGMFGFTNTQLEGSPPSVLFLDLPTPGHLARVMELAEQNGTYAGTRAMAKMSKGKPVPSGITVEKANLGEDPCLLAKVWDLTKLEGTVSFARDGTVAQVNHVAELFFSMSSDAIVNNDIKTLMTPKHALHHEEYLLRTTSEGGAGAAGGGMRKERKLVGVRRALDCVHKDGLVFETEFEVAELHAIEARNYNGAAFVGRMVLRAPGTMRPMDDRDMAKAEDETIEEGEEQRADAEEAKEEEEEGSDKKSDDDEPGAGGRATPPMIDAGLPSKPLTTAPAGLTPSAPAALAGPAGGKLPPTQGDRSRGIRFSTQGDGADAGDEGRAKDKKHSYGLQRFLQDPLVGAGDDGATPHGLSQTGGAEEHHALLRPGAADSGPALQPQPSGSISGSDGDELSEASDGQGMTQQRSKRYKAALRVLTGKNVRRVTESLILCVGVLLGTALVSYVLVFALVVGLDNRLDASTQTIDDISMSLIAFQGSMLMLRDLEAAGTVYGRNSSVVPQIVADLNAMMDEADAAWQRILLGPGGQIPSTHGNKMPEILDPQLTLENYMLGETTLSQGSMWSAVRTFLMYARITAKRRIVFYDATVRRIIRDPTMLLHKGMRGDELETTTEYRFLLDNMTPTIRPAIEKFMGEQLEQGKQVLADVTDASALVFLVELLAICLTLIALSILLVAKLRQERLRTYAIFLEVPRPVTRAIASAPISLDAESGDEGSGDEAHDEATLQQQLQGQTAGAAAKEVDDDDDDDLGDALGGGDAGKGAPAGAKRRPGLVQDTGPMGPAVVVTKSRRHKHSRMLPRGATPFLLLAPSILFLIIVGGTFLLTRRNHAAIVDPMKESYTARLLRANAVRLLYFSLEMAAGGGDVTLANGTVIPARRSEEYVAMWRGRVDTVSTLVTNLYQGLVYGSHEMDLKGALWGDVVLARLLFGDGCYRPGDDCPEDYDAEIQHGLDALLQSYVLNAWKFSREPQFMNIKSPRFNFLWEVGQTDLKIMLNKLMAVFAGREAAPRALGKKVQLIALLLVVAGTLLSYTHVFSPYNKMASDEVRRLALLFTSLPKNQVLSALIISALEREKVKGSRRGRGRKAALKASAASKQQAGPKGNPTQPSQSMSSKLMAMF
eukprot:jgi/Mesvir1/28620/Mv01030-RA.1